ncbi:MULTISPECIES: helix-turn-helix transcriptional regulator [unclassified Paenibacillus]|uniref:substrate-binding domain-containing protein n=1 Tax=unclassified Paenibacillus TaxID=185978 RepID=UPI000956EDDC|nr:MULTISPECIES: helix-turn-helix transcriptional regulator [unclassified Paenibacillus]ASS67991.1 helix-turn-helix transcriptional regulator [Paenibacillus sp. RUD330]SIR42077.1 putative molybdopterin biosynthesis protein [Paenibacillus sp. RU4X]SIR52220.1 putative molybdopterin biosynthesis protein [Paenibacillus sp. RU4T]
MNQEPSYTVEEVAQLLRISKLTVYDLVKKGRLPAYRVGKQMRVDATDLEAYKAKSKNQTAVLGLKDVAGSSFAGAKEGPGGDAASGASGVRRHEPEDGSGGIPGGDVRSGEGSSSMQAGRVSHAVAPRHQLVITGQDISLDLLTSFMEKANGTRPLRSHAGSLDSLIQMYKGEADIVSTHLWDGDTGEYNLPYITRILAGFPLLVVNLLVRRAGLYVQPGNPLGMSGWADLARPGIRFVSRERGSGARVLVDEQLRLLGIPPHTLEQDGRVQNSHLGVAAKVASGDADAGVGMEKAASMVGNVEFIPLIRERYDLVVVKKPENAPWIGKLMDILQSEAFRRELGAITGCDSSETGKVRLDS